MTTTTTKPDTIETALASTLAARGECLALIATSLGRPGQEDRLADLYDELAFHNRGLARLGYTPAQS